MSLNPSNAASFDQRTLVHGNWPQASRETVYKKENKILKIQPVALSFFQIHLQCLAPCAVRLVRVFFSQKEVLPCKGKSH